MYTCELDFGPVSAFGTKVFSNFEVFGVKFVEICDLGMKIGSWELKNAEMGVLKMAGRA